MSSKATIRGSGDFLSSQTRVVPSQLKKIISTSQSWTTPTLNHPTTIPLTKNSLHSMETCTATPDSWSPTLSQPSRIYSATMLSAQTPTRNTNSTRKTFNSDTWNVNGNDTITQAVEPALDVEAAVSAAKHVFVTKNKKNQSTQTN
jgi:hypothetical protein